MSPEGRTYFQVILPLKLEWEPWYYTDGPAPKMGERVEVSFAGRLYSGVVSSVGGTPDVDTARIQPSEDFHRALEPVAESEIRFWRFLSRYYMCTVGEVLKAAYPAGKDASEEKKARKRLETKRGVKAVPPISAEESEACKAISDAFKEKRPVLLEGSEGTIRIIEELAADYIARGKDILILTPSKPQATKYFKQIAAETGLPVQSLHSPDTYPQRREIARALRSDEAGTASIVTGTRSALYLPFSKLGLVVVADEHDSAYKIETQAPRMSGRDAAVALAAMHGADCLLCSASPSLESLYNCVYGKFHHVRSGNFSVLPPEFIDTLAEKRKNGMIGEYSRKLLSAAEAAGGEPMYICPWPLDNAVKPSGISEASLKGRSLVAILHAESLCQRHDFRADEKLVQLIARIRGTFSGPLLVQTSSRTSLPTAESLLEERKAFGMPPFKRLVDIVIKDKNEKRLMFMCTKLQERLRGSFELQGIIPLEESVAMRLIFEKDRKLESYKALLYGLVQQFEKDYKYSSHIHFNVDP